MGAGHYTIASLRDVLKIISISMKYDQNVPQ